MEQRPEKTRNLKDEDRRMMIKKHFIDKQKKKSNSSSKKDSKKSDSSKDATDSEDKASNSSEKRPDSPEPNCPICLEPMTNKSFTDSCFHTFCFTCLVEWSKVKPECPLCKQQFKSIVHNVQNDFSYDEYHINSRTTNLFTLCTEPRFRYPTTMTPLNAWRRNLDTFQENFNSQIESHRMRFAPHAVRMYSNANLMSRTPSRLRNRIYTQDLWVKPIPGNRIRTVSAEFYRLNPGCTHRLLQWLNRELLALLHYNETQVSVVLELIMALIVRYDIKSQEFFIHIEPYLVDKTSHFVHEFYNFAISPYDIETYDRESEYTGPPDTLESGPDNEVRIVQDLTARNSSAAPASGNLQLKSLKKIVIKRNADNNWETVTVPNSQNLSNPGPSTSSSTNYISTLSHSDDDECQVLQVLKPKGERTPEIVDISSDEEVLQTVINVPSDSDNSSSDSPPRFEFSPWRMIPRLLPTHKRSPLRCRFNAGVSPPSSVSWSTKYPPSPDEYLSPSYIDSDGSSTDIECVYTTEQASTSTAMPVCVPNSEKDAEKDTSSTSSTITTELTVSNVQELSRHEPKKKPAELTVGNVQDLDKHEPKKSTELTVSNVQDLSKHEPKKKLSSAIVRPWAMTVQKPPEESSPKPLISKRRASWSHLTEDSSSSDNASDERSPKKLKLRSVVAHFSFDSSDKKHDSTHRPSHKKHKDKKKKKKKKKHLHRHKHRIYSDSDSS